MLYLHISEPNVCIEYKITLNVETNITTCSNSKNVTKFITGNAEQVYTVYQLIAINLFALGIPVAVSNVHVQNIWKQPQIIEFSVSIKELTTLANSYPFFNYCRLIYHLVKVHYLLQLNYYYLIAMESRKHPLGLWHYKI